MDFGLDRFVRLAFMWWNSKYLVAVHFGREYISAQIVDSSFQDF